jgi:hypothetical protein
VLYQHLFWFYSHPAVYIMILPAMGVVSEVIPTFAHKNPYSYKAIVYSTLGIAFVGFLTWGHHMFVAGMSSFVARKPLARSPGPLLEALSFAEFALEAPSVGAPTDIATDAAVGLRGAIRRGLAEARHHLRLIAGFERALEFNMAGAVGIG